MRQVSGRETLAQCQQLVYSLCNSSLVTVPPVRQGLNWPLLQVQSILFCYYGLLSLLELFEVMLSINGFARIFQLIRTHPPLSRP